MRSGKYNAAPGHDGHPRHRLLWLVVLAVVWLLVLAAVMVLPRKARGGSAVGFEDGPQEVYLSSSNLKG